MSRPEPGSMAALSDEQRRLVREHAGLVGVHLRRNVPNLALARRDREWEDLFQEGCLGLIRAAVTYRAERGISFQAYALRRIQNAVGNALQSKFSTIAMPRRRKRRVDEDSDGSAQREAKHSPDRAAPRSAAWPPAPRTVPLDDELACRRAEGRCAPESSNAAETIGQRMRSKYERVVREVELDVGTRTSTRGDREALVRVLVEQRFLIPAEEARRPLRQIARDTRSSYARVAQCDKQFATLVRERLEGDPEFGELARLRRTDPAGVDLPIDEEVECTLAEACAAEFLKSFRESSPKRRAGMLHAVLEMDERDLERLIRGRFADLSPAERERIFARGAMKWGTSWRSWVRLGVELTENLRARSGPVKG